MRFIQHPETGEIIPANEYVRPERKRSDLSAPMLISDHMAPTWHPKDGREYESKSQFRSVTARDGSIEVGNDAQTVTREAEPLHKDVGEAIRQLKSGYRPTVDKTGSEGWG